ncbi:MAG: DMT family transporter, partial [Pseudomonadota bacterium]
EILFFRQLFMVILVAPVIYHGLPGSLRTKSPSLQALRVVFATLAMTLGFSAFIHLPLAEATAIGFSKALFITVLAILFLKETVGIRRWMAVIVGFVGVLLMIWPPGGWSDLSGVNIWSLAALGGAAAAGLVMVVIRRLTQIDQKITILSYQALFVGLLMIPPTLYYWVTPTLEEWFWLAVLGVVSVGAQACNINAYKDGEATAVSSIDYSRLVYAALLGFLLFEEIPQINTLVGASIIIAASLYTLRREAIRGKELARAQESKIYNQ